MPRTIVIPPGTIADSDAIYGPLGFGDLEQVFGSVFDTSLDGSFAEQDVETGGSANLTTINVGTQVVFVGGSATNTTIQNNGGQDVSGSVTFTTINGTASFQGGLQTIEANGSADQTTINGGTQEVFPGGSVTNTTINNGGQELFNTALADTTTINLGGLQIISGGGTASNTTINQGGQQLLESGDNFGGGTPTANATTITGGTQTIEFGTANNTTINGSGEQDVRPNGIAEFTTIAMGGTMHMAAGSGTGGTSITFTGPQGLLVIDQPVSGSASFAAQLVGVQLGDKIDLTGLPFDPATATFALTLDSAGSGSLKVSSGTNSETFSLMSDTATNFSVADDGNGGTDVTAILLNSVYYKVAAEATLTVRSGTSAVLDMTANSGATATAGNGAPSTFLVAATKIASPLSNAVGDPGNTLNGADSGMDTFVFSGNFGQNTITNFATSPGNHDTLELSKAQFGDLATMIQNGDIQQVGHNTLITDPLNSADTIKLMGVSALELESHPNNFHFV